MANPTSPTGTVTRKTLENLQRLLAEADLASDGQFTPTDAEPPPPPVDSTPLLPRRSRGR